jgi:hypothetical protein
MGAVILSRAWMSYESVGCRADVGTGENYESNIHKRILGSNSCVP